MKAAIILGNRLNDDRSFTPLMTKRLELALTLYREIKPDMIIVSGGVANKNAGIAEANAMSAYLIDNGVDAKKIVVESRSRSTAENARYSAKILKRNNISEAIICTTHEHLHRSYLNPIKLFKRACGRNIRVTGFCDNPYTQYTEAPFIVKVIKASEWEKYRSVKYIPEQKPFIHCCTVEYLWRIAHIFDEKESYVMLLINPDSLKSEIKFEDGDGCGRYYPHIYGKINVSAVAEVLPYKKIDGKFVKNDEFAPYKDR